MSGLYPWMFPPPQRCEGYEPTSLAEPTNADIDRLRHEFRSGYGVVDVPCEMSWLQRWVADPLMALWNAGSATHPE